MWHKNVHSEVTSVSTPPEKISVPNKQLAEFEDSMAALLFALSAARHAGKLLPTIELVYAKANDAILNWYPIRRQCENEMRASRRSGRGQITSSRVKAASSG